MVKMEGGGKDGWDWRREGEEREGKWGAEERGGRGIPHKGWVHEKKLEMGTLPWWQDVEVMPQHKSEGC